jgi:predicted DnaQ family exonuclease/DinG family helicase
LELILLLKQMDSRGLETTAFIVENGELKVMPAKDSVPRHALHLVQNHPGQPLLVLAPGKHIFLSELWSVLKPDQAWNGLVGNGRGADWIQVLQELWQEARRLDLSVLQETMPILPMGDPVRDFLDAASEGLILDTVHNYRELSRPERKYEPVSEFSRDQVLDILGPAGVLSRIMESYCYRPEQESMAREVCIAFERDEFLLAEAGTGVGKTLAYLIPSVYWAAANGQKVVIATRTKALQRQLAEKDLPLLTEFLPVSFTWRIAYGRDNYLCLHRWHFLKHNPDDLTVEERRLLVGLCLWLARGGQGEFQELRWDNQGTSLWKQVSCQRHGCGGNLCPWHQQCYFFAARRKLNKADIIVVNHALLLSDMATGGHILPSYQRLIIDEAHNLDRTAFEKLGVSFAVEEGLRLLAKLSEKRNGIERGYLASLKARYHQCKQELMETVRLVDLTRQAIHGLALCDIATVPGSLGPRRIKPDMEAVPELCQGCREVAGALRNVQRSLEELVDMIPDSEEGLTIYGLSGEVRDMANDLWLIGDSVELGSEEEVVWMESEPRGLSSLAAAPLDIGSELNQQLYPGLKSLILVSATLTVGRSFKYIKRRLGLDCLDPELVREWVSPSPFDYEHNCRTLAVRNLAEPGSSQYAQLIAGCVKTIARTTRKRTLVLFTARSLLLQTASLLRDEGPDLSERMICQYLDGDYSTLIAKLSGRPDGILLGSETFWEGVDLPGDMLNCLVLTRLPFRPPTEPLAEAWTERLSKQGRNAFKEYSLAEAVIRFRQGIGRLIRSETDSGVVVILDRRFCLPPAGRHYSILFRDSMPMQNIIEINHTDLEPELRKWFTDPK